MEDVSGVGRSPRGQRGRQPGIHNQQTHPSIEERHTTAESFLQVNVASSRAREAAGKFSKTKRAAHGHRPYQQPDQQQPHGGA